MKRVRFDAAGLVVPAAVLLAWFAATNFGGVPAYKLPSPQALVQVLVDFATGWYGVTPYAGTLWFHLWHSLCRVLTGFALAAACGLGLGFLTGRVPLMRRLFDPFLHMIRSIPGIGWLPIAIVWFGVGEGNTRFLIMLAAFLPDLCQYRARRGIGPDADRACRPYAGRARPNPVCDGHLPAAFPEAAVGLRLGLGVAWAYLVLGEVTGVTEGLGAVMTDGRMMGHVDIVLVTMIVIAVAGKLTDWLLLWLCRRISPQMRKGGGRA